MRTRPPTRRSTRRKGAATVELAILLPFLCFLFVAAVDYARIFYFGITLENCARNGAYYASNYPNASYIYSDLYGYKNVEEAILQDATNLYTGNDGAKPTYEVKFSTSEDGPFTEDTATANGFVRVTVKWTFKSVTKFPGLPSQVQLSRVSIMRVAPSMPSFSST